MDVERVNGEISLSPVESCAQNTVQPQSHQETDWANIVHIQGEDMHVQHAEQIQTRPIGKILEHCPRQIIADSLRNTKQTERENSCTLLEQPDTPAAVLDQKSALFPLHPHHKQ